MSTKQPINVSEIEAGDIFSEESHYRFVKKNGRGGYEFTHLESGNTVTLDEKYVQDLLITGDQYQSEVEVGKEDKLWTDKQIQDAISKGELPKDTKVRAGDVRVKGIRSIWADIYSSQVFTVCYTKQSKAISGKSVQAARDKQRTEVLAKLNAAPTGVKRRVGRPTKAAQQQVAYTFEDALKEIQENPIQTEQPGDERILCGYKTQFTSINGIYDVVDMEITQGSPLRTVNVNTIKWLVIGGTKYTVK